MDPMDDGPDADVRQEAAKTRSSDAAAYSAASPISVVFAYWKEFDLENARGLLDEQGLKIAENQESSLKNRRKLAELTRDFKKASSEEKAKHFNGLLKAFQEEVDNLTKRAKFGENAFLNVYQKLYEAPDPLPALASAAEVSSRVSELEQENRKMKQELEEFRAESAHLKNQQATVRRLDERNRQLEQQMEEKVKEMVAMKQQVLAEESQKSFETLKDRENQLHDQLRAARESVQNMQRLHELGQSQLFELRAQSEEERAAKQSEMTLLTDEVERATSRLLSLEREKEALKAQLHQAQSQEAPHFDMFDLEASSSLEVSLSAKEKIISELHVELHNVETALATERDNHLIELKKLHSILDEKETLVSNLQAELSVRPTEKQVEDLRKQVKILQAVGYNSVEVEDWDTPGRNGDMGKLETLLLEKNRKVEHELTQVKVQLSGKVKEAEDAVSQLQELEAKVAEQKALISRLEDDIVKGYGSGERRPGNADEWDAPDARITDLLQRNGNGATSGKEAPVEEEEKSMLSVVCGQRDRFRQKLVEVEEELRRMREKCSTLTAELERTKNDNVKLYEKFRYVQEYTKERGGPQHRLRKREEDLEAGGGSEVEARYKKIYEETINPFAAFSNKEKEQRYKELGLRDRITLTSGRFLMGNKHARTFVFFYSIALHVLVFLSVYRLSALSHYSNPYDSSALESKQALLVKAFAAKNNTKTV